jgi:hypothetical protein
MRRRAVAYFNVLGDELILSDLFGNSDGKREPEIDNWL